MAERSKWEVGIGSLLLAFVIGFGTNLITSDPDSWPWPLQWINRYALWWVPGLLVALALWDGFRRFQRHRRLTWVSDESPYPGLAPFGAERASVFFGREADSTAVLDRLTRSGVQASQRCIALVGPSGVGKSSVIGAGVLPRLPTRWRVLPTLRPGTDPFLALAAVLASPATQEDTFRTSALAELAKRLRQEATDLATSTGDSVDATLFQELLTAAQAGHSRVVLIGDQWEELVTTTDQEDRDKFIALLAAGLTAHPAHLLVAIRSESWPSFAPPAYAGLFASPVVIGPLDPRLLRQVIEGPATAAGIRFEPGLVDDMIIEASSGRALPLLSYLLQRLAIDAGRRKTINRNHYERAGRVAGAVAEHAAELYRTLVSTMPDRIVDETLLRFVAWQHEGEPARRRVPASSLNNTQRHVVEEFQHARLITETPDGTIFELSHESLLHHWHHLAQLATSNAARLRRRNLLEQRAQARTPADTAADLLRGPALLDAESLIAEFGCSAEANQFVEESRRMFDAEVARRADQLAHTAQQLRATNPELAVALAKTTLEEVSPTVAARLTSWGFITRPTTTRIPLGHTSTITSLVWSPDSRTFTSASQDGAICTWDRDGNLLRFLCLPEPVDDLLLSPNHDYLITITYKQRKSHLWRIDDKEPRQLGHFKQSFLKGKLAWNSHGNRLACIFGGSELLIFQISSENGNSVEQHGKDVTIPKSRIITWAKDDSMVISCTEDSIMGFSLGDKGGLLWGAKVEYPQRCTTSPDGLQAAISDAYGQIIVISLENGEIITKWDADASGTLCWSPDGAKLATIRNETLLNPGNVDLRASQGKSRHHIDIWITNSGIKVQTIPCEWRPEDIIWSPDGTSLALIFLGKGSVSVYELATGSSTNTFGGHLRNISWAPGLTGAALTSRSELDRIYLYDAAKEEIDLSLSRRVSRMPTTPAWSPAGDAIASTEENSVIVWKSANGTNCRHLEHDASTRQLTWSPDGTKLCISGSSFLVTFSATIIVWHINEDRRAVIGYEPNYSPVAWSPDSLLLAGAQKPATICVFNAENGNQIMSIDIQGTTIGTLSWSPDGEFLAVSSENNIFIHSTKTTQETACCIGHQSKATVLCWSPDGQYLVSVASAEPLRLWRPHDGTPLAAVELPEDTTVVDLRWSDESTELVATFSDHTIRRWLLPGERPIEFPANVKPLSTHDRDRYDLPRLDTKHNG